MTRTTSAPVADPEAGAPASAGIVGLSVPGGEVALPVLTLDDDALEQNLRTMASFTERHGVLLAPHGKTTMCPPLFRRQLAAGAWGLTVADVRQAQVARDAGAERILIANEVVSRPAAAWLAAHADEVDLLCLVDSVAGVALLEGALGAAGCPRQVSVLVEGGVADGRGGVRTPGAAREVGRAVGSADHLRLVGVEGYEGSAGADRSEPEVAKVDAYLDGLRALVVDLAEDGLFPSGAPVLVSAGGSLFFDRVVARLGPTADFHGHPTRLVLRSGCYLTHDDGAYAAGSPLGAGSGPDGLRAAIRVWADVLSLPEPGLAIVGLGRRDAAFDKGLPVPVGLVRRDEAEATGPLAARLVRMDDQHGYLRWADTGPEPAVGDRIAFGISHPCTTFDKWRSVLLLDGTGRVTEVLPTEFH